jgi:hypothetical protein
MLSVTKIHEIGALAQVRCLVLTCKSHDFGLDEAITLDQAWQMCVAGLESCERSGSKSEQDLVDAVAREMDRRRSALNARSIDINGSTIIKNDDKLMLNVWESRMIRPNCIWLAAIMLCVGVSLLAYSEVLVRVPRPGNEASSAEDIVAVMRRRLDQMGYFDLAFVIGAISLALGGAVVVFIERRVPQEVGGDFVHWLTLGLAVTGAGAALLSYGVCRTNPNPGAAGRAIGSLSGMILGPVYEGVWGAFFGVCLTLFYTVLAIVFVVAFDVFNNAYVFNQLTLSSAVSASIANFIAVLCMIVKICASTGTFLGFIDGLIAACRGQTVFRNVGVFLGWVCDSVTDSHAQH